MGIKTQVRISIDAVEGYVDEWVADHQGDLAKKIKEAIEEQAANIDIDELVRTEVNAVFELEVQDAVRHGVRAAFDKLRSNVQKQVILSLEEAFRDVPVVDETKAAQPDG